MDDVQKKPEFESSDTSQSLLEYGFLIWQWLWLVVLSGVLASSVAYFTSSNVVPTYQTSTILFISLPNLNSVYNNNGFVSSSMTTTYSQMITNLPVLKGVVDTLSLGMDPTELQKMITIAEIPDSQLITVTVNGTDPVLIVQIANALSASFAERMSELQSQRFASSKQALQTQMDEMKKQVELTATELANTQAAAQKQEVETRLTQYRQIYASLLNSFEQARIADAQTSTTVMVADPAVSALQVGPKTARDTALATITAVLFAIGVIIGINSLDDTLRNPEELQQKYGLPILGIIAQFEMQQGPLITRYQPRSMVTESFRNLRTNIKFSSVDVPLRRILVTSPTPADGKSTISANLAVVFAQGEKKVVLIDADMRRPTVKKMFNLSGSAGLSDLFVLPEDEAHTCIQNSSIPNLRVITSGDVPPNPADLLGSQKMVDILYSLSRDCDLIILDTPPVLSVTDAAALSLDVDGVILVVKPGKTKRAAFRQALLQLKTIGARLLGVVINDVEPSSRKYGYYYRSYYRNYYSKYSYYSHDDGTKGKKSKRAGKVKEQSEG